VLSPSCGDTSLLAFPHLRLSDDLDGNASFGVATAMGSIGVVEAQESVEVKPQPRVYLGMRYLANAGFQHSSRIVFCPRST
jgi:hypothetical protein